MATIARLIILFAALMAVWLLKSGHYTPLIIGFGVVSAAFATWMAYRIKAHDREGLPLHIMPRLPGYLLWLFWQIIISNIATAKLILGDRKAVTPTLILVPAEAKSAAAIAIYANSITLTPGTVTVEIDDEDGILVHALSRDLARDVSDGEMARRIVALEQGGGR